MHCGVILLDFAHGFALRDFGQVVQAGATSGHAARLQVLQVACGQTRALYAGAMEYEYDDDKSERTFQDRRIDFDFAVRVFDGDLIEYEDRRKDYGESRFVVIGPIEGRLFTVAYTWRNDRRRIISARRSSRRERRAYQRTIA